MLDAKNKSKAQAGSGRLLNSALEELARFFRFGLVGAANTLIGLGIIAFLDLGLHLRPAIANAAGYAVGICLSFVLSREFVFRSQRTARTTAPMFFAAAAI